MFSENKIGLSQLFALISLGLILVSVNIIFIFKFEAVRRLKNQTISIKLEISKIDRGNAAFQKENLNKEISLLGEDFNEFNGNNTLMFIDGKKVPFSKRYKFKKEGWHTVEYKFSHKITSLNSIFSDCSFLNEIDLSRIVSDGITDMTMSFFNCPGLTNVRFGRRFNTRNVLTMYALFCYCQSLKEVDLEHFDTEKVRDMGSMFAFCTNLKKIDISHFKTNNLRMINDMFSYCTNLNYVNLCSIHFDKLKKYDNLLEACQNNIKLVMLKDQFNNHINKNTIPRMNNIDFNC